MQPNNPEQFTEKAFHAISNALDIARACQHQQMESEHLLKALLEPDSLTAAILTQVSVNLSEFWQELDRYTQQQPKISGTVGSVYLGKSLDLLLDRAEATRASWQDRFISIEHLILAATEDDRIGRQLFTTFNLDRSQLEITIRQLRGAAPIVPANLCISDETLSEYGENLTELARVGKVDPVFGRDEEIRRIIEILSCRQKNSPVLIGKAGIGKTAIVEGLAQRIIEKDVPEILKNCTLISLDLGGLITGKYRGEFEGRLRSVLNKVTESAGEIILFIDDLHTIIGGNTAGNAKDAIVLLKPLLSRGTFRCISATTIDAYQNIAANPDTARLFQPIQVAESTIEDTISILRGLKERYEVHHGVKISDSALVSATILSSKYITNRCLPDKAIDLVDLAAVKLKMEITSKPEKLDEIDRKVMQMEMERLSVYKDDTPTTRERLQNIERKLTDLKQEQYLLTTQWQFEKDIICSIQTIKQEIDTVKFKIQQALRGYDLSLVAELTHKTLHELNQKLKSAESQIIFPALLREDVSERDIAEVVAQWTGIPVSQISPTTGEQLLPVEVV